MGEIVAYHGKLKGGHVEPLWMLTGRVAKELEAF